MNNLPADIINTFEMSQDAWAIKDKNSCFIYGNNAVNSLLSLDKKFTLKAIMIMKFHGMGLNTTKNLCSMIK